MGKKAALNIPIDLGISEKERAKIAEGLSHLLADTYTLYLKTHNFHWNVKGPMFQTLHLMFETQYTELALAVDLIAERIRALGVPAPGPYKEYAQLSSIKDTDGVPEAAVGFRPRSRTGAACRSAVQPGLRTARRRHCGFRTDCPRDAAFP